MSPRCAYREAAHEVRKTIGEYDPVDAEVYRGQPCDLRMPVRPPQLVEIVGGLDRTIVLTCACITAFAVERKRRAYGFTQNELASRVGISRPQLTNGLRGRFGFGADATARLKDFLLEDVQ